MKLLDTLILSLATVFFVIGVHQTFLMGDVKFSYVFFMCCAVLYLWYMMRKKSENQEVESSKFSAVSKNNKAKASTKKSKKS